MREIELGVKALTKTAVIPDYAYADDFCFDLAVDSIAVELHADGTTTAVVGTGLAFDIPQGWGLLVFSRSGHGFKHGIRLGNGTGIIDRGYKGELMVKLIADLKSGAEVLRNLKKGDRIAQATLVERPMVKFKVISDLSGSERGVKGLGSTNQ
ncbi:dUTP diphosphatase [Acinetobacter variabilis]|uniref:dUTP diphosphatase n=1 Tax=Acinetobacter variabilis TaxID=70346 RepID=N8WYR7_9GAMM|nr:hypothetical protein [Acinetobacter variabilis]ENV00423.1 hypothetical protein F969_00655 [Acinetobacter variabilis]